MLLPLEIEPFLCGAAVWRRDKTVRVLWMCPVRAFEGQQMLVLCRKLLFKKQINTSTCRKRQDHMSEDMAFVEK